MILGVPREVSAHATMTADGVDSFTRATFVAADGTLAQMQCGFTGCRRTRSSSSAKPGSSATRPVQAPDTYTSTWQATRPTRCCSYASRPSSLLDLPNIGNAPGYNFVGSQGFVHEAAAGGGSGRAVGAPGDAARRDAARRAFEKIRAQIGLTYPWDEEGEGAAKKALL